MITISLVPALKDNYSYLLEAPDGSAAVVDPTQSAPVEDALAARGLGPSYIFNTHHHADHTGGNLALKAKYGEEFGTKIVGPEADRHRIPGMDIGLEDGDIFPFGGEEIHVIATPGHTSGHICLHLPDSKALFSGDTLFAMGCGRLFEGTAAQMFDSLARIKALPADTRLYCGHEYTYQNGRFCASVEPCNPDIQARLKHVKALREKGTPTIPATLAEEMKTNVFLRAQNVEDFAECRRRKDHF